MNEQEIHSSPNWSCQRNGWIIKFRMCYLYMCLWLFLLGKEEVIGSSCVLVMFHGELIPVEFKIGCPLSPQGFFVEKITGFSYVLEFNDIELNFQKSWCTPSLYMKSSKIYMSQMESLSLKRWSVSRSCLKPCYIRLSPLGAYSASACLNG